MFQTSEFLRKTPCRVARAAELLGKTVEATYQDVARGRLPHRRIGRSLFFFEEEIIDFLDKQPGVRPDEVHRNGIVKNGDIESQPTAKESTDTTEGFLAHEEGHER